MRVYTFGNGAAEGHARMVDVLGGKGAGLAGMAALGVPVPPGFTIPVEICAAFHATGTLPPGLWAEILRGIKHIEELRGELFGDGERPLLVSVRSGAAVSMPGMMDTVLDVGLNPATRAALARRMSRPRSALDSHRRFIEMYAEVALDVDPELLAEVRDDHLEALGLRDVAQLDEAGLLGLVQAWERRLAEEGAVLPEAPLDQLRGAIEGVLRSWNSRRAVRFRREHGIPDEPGTAVTVQCMVFGNLGQDSATGVAFTRDPNTGEPSLFGEFLPDAQGEDVVSGAYTPEPLSALAARQPGAYAEIEQIARTLEEALGAVQDLEFTVERGRVWMLQTRAAQQSARAEVRTAVEMAEDGLITQDQALARVNPERLTRLLHPSVDVADRRRVVARGLPASPGAVTGRVVFDPDEVVARAGAGEAVILVRVETSTDDMDAIRVATGVLTSRGGMTSHAALVARGLGRTCVTGCADVVVDERAGVIKAQGGRLTIEAGSWITLDGGTGEVILGRAATTPAAPPATYRTLMDWADGRRRLAIMASADNGAEAREAFAQGADGVGLCRTEHMFLGQDRLALVRELVFAFGEGARRRVLDRILPVQREDFASLLAVTGERPVAIRLLDIPLHEIVPDEDEDVERLAGRLNVPIGTIQQRMTRLRAHNPLLGHRGCRLGLTFPEVYAVQIRALFEAVLAAEATPAVKVVIPLLSCGEELRRLRRRIDHMVRTVAAERGAPVPAYTLGAMVETPRACLMAGELAEASDFFLFGANDLTRATFLLARDDASRFLPFYLEHDVLPADPFVALDEAGVGELIRLAIARGRAVRPDLRCGLSGAQTGAPATVAFCHRVGMDYLTCPMHRVPVARLAAAQAAVHGDLKGAA
ncbi:MAG: pyruvate, phosphate dikinase [bacterium]